MAKKTSLAAKAREAGMPYGTVHHRVKKLGWSEKRALTTPVRHRNTPGQVEDATFEPSPTPDPSAENTTNPDTLRNVVIGLCLVGLIVAWVTYG
jgi:hypothetical protein